MTEENEKFCDECEVICNRLGYPAKYQLDDLLIRAVSIIREQEAYLDSHVEAVKIQAAYADECKARARAAEEGATRNLADFCRERDLREMAEKELATAEAALKSVQAEYEPPMGIRTPRVQE